MVVGVPDSTPVVGLRARPRRGAAAEMDQAKGVRTAATVNVVV
jgi:hypothetical protein